MRSLGARIARIEAGAGGGTRVPCLVIVGTGQTPSAALASFAAAYPRLPRNHALLVVPAKPTTDHERERFARRFRDTTLQLVAQARSERLAMANASPDASSPVLDRPTARHPDGPSLSRSGSTFRASNKPSRIAFAKLAGIPTTRD